NSPAGTTALINPQSAAVPASIASPVSSICNARFLPMERLNATIGVVQNSPMRTPLYFGNHRLRNRLNLHHELSTNIEDLAIVANRALHHLAQVVSRTENFA